MSHQIIIWVVLLGFAGSMVLGTTVASVLMAAGLLGITLWVGPQVLYGMLAQDIYFTSSTYSLSIIPLYLLMAQLLLRGGVIIDLFRVAHRWAGFRRFPLGAATLLTGGMLGAVSGSGAASAAALATLAAPELEKVGYDRNFAVAVAAVAGSLSAIIPPSLIIIIYGSLTSVPIGQLFIGAIGPSVLCVAIYIFCIWAFAKVRPDAATTLRGPGPDEDLENHRSVPAFLFVIVLMVTVFGGIYGGVVTVGEAGALGAMTALVGMIVMRRISVRDLGIALTESVKVTAMLMMLVIAAAVFAKFLSFSRIPRELVLLAEPLLTQQVLLLVILLVAIFFAGMFLESAAVMILLIPIFTPMLLAANVDMLWFGVMASFMITIGLVTPPVGLAAYAASTSAKVPVSAVFRHTTLFAIMAAVGVTLATILFPGLITWLPSKIN
jgi:C4-dicarboxylate transporter, DctM subunit